MSGKIYIFGCVIVVDHFAQSDPIEDVAKLALSLLIQETDAHPNFLDIKLGNGVVLGFLHLKKLTVRYVHRHRVRRSYTQERVLWLSSSLS